MPIIDTAKEEHLSRERVGVLVGCDQSQEWLLDWFYTHFRKYNPDCPIAFADFGMSPDRENWCRERGVVLAVPELSTKGSELPGSLFQGEFYEEYKLDLSGWTSERLVIFRKPLALAQSPFKRTLWLDLDCQVRGDLAPLMSLALASDKLGATPSGSFFYVKNLSKNLCFLVDKYNTGVILTEKKSALLDSWISLIDGRISFSTDEGSLSFLVEKNQMRITEIPHQYNWPVHVWGENQEALIYHWLGKEAKQRLHCEISFTSS